jgi:hypothetical protein
MPAEYYYALAGGGDLTWSNFTPAGSGSVGTCLTVTGGRPGPPGHNENSNYMYHNTTGVHYYQGTQSAREQ